jgi:hypothetical protein
MNNRRVVSVSFEDHKAAEAMASKMREIIEACVSFKV